MTKRILFLMLAAGSFIQVQAQQARVVSAYNYLNNYLKEKDPDDLRNARKSIDEAIGNDGTASKPKTWYYRGNVYLAISGEPALKQEVPDALRQAADAYLKVYELDPKYESAEESWQKANISYKNLGIMAFNENKFEEALTLFEKVAEINAKRGVADREAIENCAIAAVRAQNYDKAVPYLKLVITFNTDTTGINYVQLYKVYQAQKDTAAAYETLKEGRKKFPKNQHLMTEELNYHLQKGNNTEAERLLKEAIAGDPTNHILYLAAGSTYENLGKRKEAIEAYEKAIELNPKAWEGYYNLGANYNNEGRRLQEIANNEKDTKKYEAGIKLADEELKKALVYLEKAREIVPAGKDRVDVLNALKQLYVRLNMTDKYNEVKQELEKK